jgi:DNA-binding NarL/FixJ family response regulator
VNRVRVLLADDHADFLAAAVRLLGSEYEVVAAVGDGQAVLDEAARLEPDVLVLDISMPVLNGIEAARRLTAAGSGAKVVFLTVHQDPDSVRAALAAGAQGYVVKCRLVSDLPLALRDVLAGRSFVSPSIARDPAN